MTHTTRRVVVESLESRRLLSAVRLGSISGSVFADLDRDGVHEAGEGGVKNAVVFLDLNGNRRFDKKTDLSAVTDKRGAFTFSNLNAGTYRMYELGDANSAVSAPRAGWYKITLAAGQNIVRRQFGNVSTSTATTANGVIDLNDNDAIIHNNMLAGSELKLPSHNTGFWNIGTQFNGRPVANTDVVIKYTYNGDTDFNGTVNGADYARIDTSFNTVGGSFGGDFDYNGKVDAFDYALIDAAFNHQGTVQLGRNGTLAGPADATTTVATTAPRTARSPRSPTTSRSCTLTSASPRSTSSAPTKASTTW
jgi:hypothetical protein